MNLNQIKYFLEVCNTLNFTKAAQNLYVSQPSLSRQIQILEEELGIQLLIRGSRNVLLTEAGIAFREEFEQIMCNIEHSLSKVKEASIPKKVIRIGILQPISRDMIFEFLEKINTTYCDYQVLIYKYSTTELKMALETGKINIAITLKEICIDFTSAECSTIKNVRAVLIYSRKMFSKGLDSLSLNQFNGKKLICIDEEYAPGLLEYQLELIKRLDIQVSEVVKVGDVLNTIVYAEPMQGFAIFYENTELMRQHDLTYWPITDRKIQFEIVALWKQNTTLNFTELF